MNEMGFVTFSWIFVTISKKSRNFNSAKNVEIMQLLSCDNIGLKVGMRGFESAVVSPPKPHYFSPSLLL